MEWVTEALRESDGNARKFHAESVARLQDQQARPRVRIEAMYEDKLDGVVSTEFFERKSNEWVLELARLSAAIDAHRTANQSYIEDGLLLLDLARSAGRLFREQPAAEKRNLLDLVLLNCSSKDGQLRAEYRQPCYMLAAATEAVPAPAVSGSGVGGRSEEWWAILDLNQ